MNILIINPPGRIETPPAFFPLGLGYIASVLLRDGHFVKALDFEGNRPSPTTIYPEGIVEAKLKETLNEMDFGIVMIGALTNRYKYVKWLDKTIKKIKPKIKIMLGNTVASDIPELVLRKLEVDIVCLGEGEITSQEVVRTLENGRSLRGVKGIWFKENGQIYRNPPRKLISNLDELPFPAWDLFPVETYINNFKKYISCGKRGINIVMIRGCPYRCKYCCKIFKRTVRWRSADSVIKEIKELKRRYGVEYISFADENSMVNKKLLYEFCRKLKEEKLNIKWGCAGRVDLIDEDIVREMRSAGCVFIGMGIESSSQKIFDNMQKDQTVEQIIRAIDIIRKVGGIIEDTSFMIGYPGETRETILETTEFRIKNKLPGNYFITTAYPGAVLYEEAKNGLIKDEDKYLESLENPNELLINFTDIPDEELLRLKEEMEKRIARNLLFYRFVRYFKIRGFSYIFTYEFLNDFFRKAFYNFKLIFGKKLR